eukprot:scaffold1793_cov399-Prasinococcus_capsulatus_cf.AAC.5
MSTGAARLSFLDEAVSMEQARAQITPEVAHARSPATCRARAGADPAAAGDACCGSRGLCVGWPTTARAQVSGPLPSRGCRRRRLRHR